MNFVLLTILFIGFTFIIVGYIKSKQDCPPPQIEYRYVPRTFREEQEDPTPITEIFEKMFLEPTNWIRHSAGKLPPPNLRQHPRDTEDINQMFISQS